MEANIEKLKKALANAELYEYVTGQKDYGILNPYADTPTDPAEVFRSFVEYWIESKDENLWIEFQKVLINLSKDPRFGWLAMHYLLAVKRYVDRVDPNRFDVSELVNEIVPNLEANKLPLSTMKEWVGADNDDGLWEEVQRMAWILRDRYDLDVSIG